MVNNVSYALMVKNECASQQLELAEAKSQLGAFILGCGSLVISNKSFNLILIINQASMAKRAMVLLKQVYGLKFEIETYKRNNLNKNNIFRLRLTEMVKDILFDLGLYQNGSLNKILSTTHLIGSEKIGSYLAGWFMAKGSINDPASKTYHFEITCVHKKTADQIVNLVKHFGITLKVCLRREKYVLYVKSAESVGDMLRLMRCHNSLMHFENIRIDRDFHNSLRRLDNCEVANDIKSIEAGKKQIQAIDLLIANNRLQFLDKKLFDVAILRQKYPEASLNELCQYLFEYNGEEVTKSGLRHRLNKLLNLAKIYEVDDE